LLEKEADACQNYARLVDVLLAAGERDKARQWCVLGFERTVESAPGIAADLQKRLREMAHAEKNHVLVAAYRAEEFFDRASRQAYTELRKAAENAKVWLPVREGVLRYLETGRRPDADGRGKKSTAWPLPIPEVMRSSSKTSQRHERFPDLDMLIGIAILEKRFDDVVALYAELRKTKRWSFETDKTVADAVAETHPQVALDIWRFIVDGLIGQVKPKAYEEAAVYLRRMCKVYQESRRIAEWHDLLGEYDKISYMESLLPVGDFGIEDKSREIVARSAALGGHLHPISQRPIMELLRIINSYYSNLIEGHSTHPVDIERAMRHDYAEDPAKRDLQLESQAHVNCQMKIEERLRSEPDLNVASAEFITWVHKTRGDMIQFSGMAERTGRMLLGQLLDEGMLVSDMRKGPVRIAFPTYLAGYLFPDLYPLQLI